MDDSRSKLMMVVGVGLAALLLLAVVRKAASLVRMSLKMLVIIAIAITLGLFFFLSQPDTASHRTPVPKSQPEYQAERSVIPPMR